MTELEKRLLNSLKKTLDLIQLKNKIKKEINQEDNTRNDKKKRNKKSN